MMALETQRILFVAISIVVGGVLGSWWNVEGGILQFGRFLERRVSGGKAGRRRSDGSDGLVSDGGVVPDGEEPELSEAIPGSSGFAHGFLNASILFCVGAMTIVGAFRAGADHSYDLILTKSVMDGAVSILLAAAMGVGVAFSVITILVYQGGLTLLAGLIRPYVSDLVLSELSGAGGILIMMIGLNLLDLKELKTGNFLPALLVVLLFTLLEPLVLRIFSAG
jgi:uncharacterized membrane protein YqgA involved in biofilm formation